MNRFRTFIRWTVIILASVVVLGIALGWLVRNGYDFGSILPDSSNWKEWLLNAPWWPLILGIMWLIGLIFATRWHIVVGYIVVSMLLLLYSPTKHFLNERSQRNLISVREKEAAILRWTMNPTKPGEEPEIYEIDALTTGEFDVNFNRGTAKFMTESGQEFVLTALAARNFRFPQSNKYYVFNLSRETIDFVLVPKNP